MRIDVDEMQSGANLAYGAAWLALEGAEGLSVSRVCPEAFGAFPAARAFGAVLKRAHRTHVEMLRDHEAGLNVLGDKGYTTAATFAAMEERTAEALRTVL